MTTDLLHLNAAQVKNGLPWQALVAAIDALFLGECEMPLRHHHSVCVPNEDPATLLMMRAWVEGRYLGGQSGPW